MHGSRADVFTTSAADGTFRLEEVPEDSALVVAAKEGFAFTSVARGDGEAVTLKLKRDTKPARAEYPRPDSDRRPFTDDAWLALDGTWSFDFDPRNVGEAEHWFDPAHQYSKAIRVPFGYQSLAAWGEEQLATNEIFRSAFSTYRGAVWYRRSFTVPTDFAGHGVRLRIGAADYGAAVWLDGKAVLPYSGDGYTEITTDLGRLKPGATHTVAIRVVAPATTPESPYPAGKQTGPPAGDATGWFTDIGGIWQPVWIEPVNEARLITTLVTPELSFDGDDRTPSRATARINVSAVGADKATVRIKGPDGTAVGSVEVPLADGKGEATFTIEEPRLWEPADPALYTADFRLGDDDGVRTTFGLRKVERKWAPGHTGEYQYVYLNNRPIYVRGVLDQAYNPWGVYSYTGVTAGPDLESGTEADPGRGSMLRDLKEAKRLGFNVVRTHVKINDPTYYHLADKLGLMIWYDFPNAGWYSLGEKAEQLFEELLRNTLERDNNHPSIVFWSLFNESWGINEQPWGQPIPPEAFPYVKNMVAITRSTDPSRLVVDNSACCLNGHLDTDLNDFHYYLSTYDEWKGLLDAIDPLIKSGSDWNFNDGAQSGQPWLNSEFGINQGQFPHTTSLFRGYPKLNGYVGVQLAEIEQEVTSQITFDRQPNQPPFVDHTGKPRDIDLFQDDDAVSLMGPSTRTLNPGETIVTPVRLSHFSDHDLSNAQLRWKIGGYDDHGRWMADAGGGARPVDPERYTVTDAGTISIQAPASLRVGYLWVWLEAGGRTIAENYLTYDTPGPANEAAFAPSKPAERSWTGGAEAFTAGGSDWVTGRGRGYFEYEVKVPDEVRNGTVKVATLVAEVASAQAEGWYDAIHVTGARRFPANLTVSVNGAELPAVLLPDDPNGPMALAGRRRGPIPGDYGNRYGYRVAVPITAKALGNADTATLRFSSDGGGLSIFGARSGRYGIPPRLVAGNVRVPDDRPDFTAADTRLSVYQAAASISPASGTGRVMVSVVNDTAKATKDVSVRLTAPTGWTVTPVGNTRLDSLAPGAARHVAFDIATDTAVSPGDTVAFTATASWAGRATQVISGSVVGFDPAAYSKRGVDDNFDIDSSAAYSIYQPSSSEAVPDLTFGDGKLRSDGPGAYFGLVAHESGPATPKAVVIVDPEKWAGTGQGQDAMFAGLVKDERNYVMAWTGVNGQHGIDVVIDGSLSNACCWWTEPFEAGDRWAFALDGNEITVWADRGLGWTQISSGTTQGRVDFTKPEALAGWHYAVGLRGNAGVQAVGRLEGRSMP
ncbi:hypothetical protein GCM10027569_92250 [Flindersiella endophytica]